MGIHYGKADFINYGKPSLLLDFARNKSLVDRISGDNLITFERASTGTYVGADGLIKTAAADEPRFDHNPDTLESLGLLVEQQRTNKMFFSEDFIGGWATNSVVKTADAGVAPDGETTADEIYATSTNVNQGLTNRAFASFTQNIWHTFSLFWKAGTSNGVNIQIPWNDGGNAGAVANFLLDGNGNLQKNGNPGGYGNYEITDSFVEKYPNGWWRVGVTFRATAAVSGSNGQVWIYPSIQSNGSRGTNLTSYLWGAQMEVGDFPTSYMPTSSISTRTRNADLAYITQANMQSWYNNTEGTIFSHSIGYRGEGGIAYFGSNSEGWGLFQNGSYLTNKGRGSYTPDLASDLTILYNTYENVKAGISINDTTNLSNYAVNGVIRGDSQTRSGPFTYPTGFGLAQADVVSTNQVTHSLCLNRIVYYPVSLSSTQLQELTQ
jgi:hypothetical protein